MSSLSSHIKQAWGKIQLPTNAFFSLPPKFVDKLLKEGGKKIAIESTAEKKELKKQINELFKLIEEIIERNDGGFYSEEKFKAAEEAFRKRIPKIQQEAEKLFEGKKKSLEDEYREKAKRFEERENTLAKKLQEQKEKFEQEKQLKEKEKLEKDARAVQMKKMEAKHQEEMKSVEEKLEKERKEKEKTKEDYERKLEEINKNVVQDLRTTIIEDRSNARDAIPESKCFREMARNVVKEGAGLAYDVVTRGIETAIGAIGRLLLE